MLGNTERYDESTKHDFVAVEALEARLMDTTNVVKELLVKKKVTTGQAATLRGRILHILQTRVPPNWTGSHQCA